MNKFIPIALLVLGTCFVQAQAGRATGDLVVVPKTEEFVLGGTRHYDFQSIGRALGTRVIQSLADGRILIVRPPKGVDWQDYRKTLLATGTYASVEPNTVAMPTATADDPSLNTQWHLFQISAPRAWDFEAGTNSPILAVVDGGVNLTHPDLAPNLVPGYNTISGLAQTSGGAVNDITTSGHGTRTAGVAAAKGNNGVGVSGVGWNLRLMPIRATDNVSGATPRSELLEGVQWAVNNGAKVVSVSYTEVEYADVEAMGAWARTQGVLLVWSAGNTNTNWANFDHDNVTVVGGTDQSDNRWVQNATTGSGYGKGVDCFAPCTQIYTIRKDGTYGNAPAGVSFAVPQVAATLALMMGRSPTLNPAEIEQRLLLRCGNMGPLGNDITYGFGRLNAGAAVEWPIRKYQLQLLSVLGIPNAIDVTPWRITDDGQVYGTVTRSGESIAIAIWTNGVLRLWYPTESLFSSPGSGAEIRDVNENGAMVGVFSPGEARGFYWKENVASFMIDAGFPRTYWNGINNSGESVGIGMYTFTNIRGRYRDPANGQLSNPLESPPYNVGGSNGFWKIAEDGTVIGSIGTTPILYHPTRGITFCEAPPSGTAISIQEATEEGAFVGNWSYPISGGWYNYALLYGAKGQIIKNFGGFTYPTGMNENLEVVGSDMPGDTSFAGARIFSGFNPGMLIDRLVPQPNNPNQILPPSVTSLEVAFDVNNVGQIVVRGDSALSRKVAMVANPVDTPGLAVSLGQLGSSPTYIGSIPPTLSVTFTDTNGTPYSGATVQLGYASSIGRLSLTPPAAVTGNYRIYMRCNSTAIPGYTGTPFLSRLYPPIGTPAVPRDAFYLPYNSSTSYDNQPILELYAGDVDQSGEIDAADIDAVIATFGMVNGDPGFGPTDVDGTGEIDAADIDLVIANFGLVGDPEP